MLVGYDTPIEQSERNSMVAAATAELLAAWLVAPRTKTTNIAAARRLHVRSEKSARAGRCCPPETCLFALIRPLDAPKGSFEARTAHRAADSLSDTTQSLPSVRIAFVRSHPSSHSVEQRAFVFVSNYKTFCAFESASKDKSARRSANCLKCKDAAALSNNINY